MIKKNAYKSLFTFNLRYFHVNFIVLCLIINILVKD